MASKNFYQNALKDSKKGSEFDIPGPKKAAIVIVALGPENSSELLKGLSETEVEALTKEVARMEGVTSEMREAVLKEFHTLGVAQQFVSQGGIEYARELLEKTYGPLRAAEVLAKITKAIRTTGFHLLTEIDAGQLVNFIQKEHPQTIALILAHMDKQVAAKLLGALPQDLQFDVAQRIATMESITPDVLEQIEQVLTAEMKDLVGGDASEVGGVKALAELLNLTDRSTEKNVMGHLERENPELSTEIKNLMFTFDDIMLLDDRGMQRLLKEVDSKILALSLKNASEEMRGKFLRNMSQRAAEMISEEIQFMGPVKLRDVEEGQQKIVDSVRRLEDAGEVVISGRGGGDEIVV
jgi:flagellar motor switch protein FliG